MSRVFADTSFYQALLSPRDGWHQIAIDMFRELDASIVTTEYILLELGSMMSRGHDRMIFVEFVQNLSTDPDTTILPTSNALFEKGFSLFASRQDKDWSFYWKKSRSRTAEPISTIAPPLPLSARSAWQWSLARRRRGRECKH